MMVSITIKKARLVVKMFFWQVQGVDYNENFSPVAMLKSVGIVLALAVFFDYEILQMDVKTSFLTSFRKKELYVIQSKFCRS